MKTLWMALLGVLLVVSTSEAQQVTPEPLPRPYPAFVREAVVAAEEALPLSSGNVILEEKIASNEVLVDQDWREVSFDRASRLAAFLKRMGCEAHLFEVMAKNNITQDKLRTFPKGHKILVPKSCGSPSRLGAFGNKSVWAMEGKRTTLEHKLKDAEKRVAELRGQIENCKDDPAKIRDLEAKLRTVTEERDRLREENKKLLAANTTLVQENKALGTEKAELIVKNVEQAKKISELEALVLALKEKIKSLEANVGNMPMYLQIPMMLLIVILSIFVLALLGWLLYKLGYFGFVVLPKKITWRRIPGAEPQVFDFSRGMYKHRGTETELPQGPELDDFAASRAAESLPKLDEVKPVADAGLHLVDPTSSEKPKTDPPPDPPSPPDPGPKKGRWSLDEFSATVRVSRDKKALEERSLLEDLSDPKDPDPPEDPPPSPPSGPRPVDSPSDSEDEVGDDATSLEDESKPKKDENLSKALADAMPLDSVLNRVLIAKFGASAESLKESSEKENEDGGADRLCWPPSPEDLDTVGVLSCESGEMLTDEDIARICRENEEEELPLRRAIG